ncbi:MAG: hypothetical protein O2971_04465 [Proteobacteria bacterium]|nr:hypothetical protein [Pseudomonadota bacterium]
MNYKTLLTALLITSFAGSDAQVDATSNVPDSVRAMIERSQATDRYEQMARMQVDVQFGAFLSKLVTSVDRKQQIEAALVEVFKRRAELSAQMTTGTANPTELSRVSNPQYLRARLSELLTADELQKYDAVQTDAAEQQLRQTYGNQLARIAPSLTPTNRTVVLDSLVRHMLLLGSESEIAGSTSADSAISAQLESLMRVRMELQAQLDGIELKEAESFLNQVQSGLSMNRAMFDTR